MPILCCSKFCRTGNSNSERVPAMDGSPECERYIFYGKGISLPPRFSLLEHDKAEYMLSRKRVPHSFSRLLWDYKHSPIIALTDILPTVSLSPDILVGGEPPETVGKLQQPRGKHFVIWKLRFHLNFKPLFLINTAGCIFLFCLFYRNAKWTAHGWMD